MKFLRTAMDGFDVGLVVWKWRRYGPFMWYQEMLGDFMNPTPPLSGWKFAVFLSKEAMDEFYEGSTK